MNRNFRTESGIEFQITYRAIVQSSTSSLSSFYLYIYLFLISLIIIIITNVCRFILRSFVSHTNSFDHMRMRESQTIIIHFVKVLSVKLAPLHFPLCVLFSFVLAMCVCVCVDGIAFI